MKLHSDAALTKTGKNILSIMDLRVKYLEFQSFSVLLPHKKTVTPTIFDRVKLVFITCDKSSPVSLLNQIVYLISIEAVVLYGVLCYIYIWVLYACSVKEKNC